MFPKPYRLPTVGPSGSLPVRLSAVLTVLVLVPACAGCGPSAGSGQGAPEEGAGQARDVVEETAAAATGQALAGSDWSSYNVFFAVPDDAIALSISFPADWVASYSDAGVSVGNAVADDASSLSDGELDAQLDIEIVGDDRCGEASDLDESAAISVVAHLHPGPAARGPHRRSRAGAAACVGLHARGRAVLDRQRQEEHGRVGLQAGGRGVEALADLPLRPRRLRAGV
ncbi:MAG: hypothetical protein ACK2UL_01095, partial [Anaerolineae bacterium]